jgi:hypothetical protein
VADSCRAGGQIVVVMVVVLGLGFGCRKGGERVQLVARSGLVILVLSVHSASRLDGCNVAKVHCMGSKTIVYHYGYSIHWMPVPKRRKKQTQKGYNGIANDSFVRHSGFPITVL